MNVPLDDDVLGVRLAEIRRDREEGEQFLKIAARAYGEGSEKYLEWEQRVTTLKLMLVELEARCIAAEHARLRMLQAFREYGDQP